ncbi:A-kinase anchor protein 13 isoform X2 [Electrophorus electricus]|uniref:A-kinase anchor protein 13 isoform X2 n=1 Tax=Electrophorus electricus TaxID=8005 RepID=UPI0015D0C8C8|nr:A-kinase anchor protein 13 isoform X2 [Electrophorus electricus]
MKLNPRQAPLYGSCVLTIQLSDEELGVGVFEGEDVELFLVLTGSTQRHVSSVLRLSRDTLQLVCPAHDCCETVVVTLCWADPHGLVHQLASEHMCFTQDLAFDMAHFLVGSVGHADMLEGVLLLDEHQIPLQECERLDQSLALALAHLTPPPGLNLLGNSGDPEPQETLLHFAARRGLCRVASFLLQQPGARDALALPNKQGATPASLAHSSGHRALLELLTQWLVSGRETTGTRHSTETRHHVSSGACVVQHHPCLNTYTLSVGTQPGTAPRNLQADVQDLRHLIFQGGAARDHADVAETKGACFEQLQHDSLDSGEQGSTPACVKGSVDECAHCEDLLWCEEGDSVLGSSAISEEERVCSRGNVEGDYGARVPGAVACVGGPGREGDSGDSLQSQSEGESRAVQAPSCGKEGEETDRAQDLICETQGSTEGPSEEVQEEGCSSERPNQPLEKELSEHRGASGDMGITQSLDTPESSDGDSCSHDTYSSDETKVENGNTDSLELEGKRVHKELPDLTPATDQLSNSSCEKGGNETNVSRVTCSSPSSTADTEHFLKDSQEINTRQNCCDQTSDSYEIGAKEQEKDEGHNSEVQEDGTPDILSPSTETESRKEQCDITCHHRDISDNTLEDRCQEKSNFEETNEPQAFLGPECNGHILHYSGFELDVSSSVTFNAVSGNNSPLLEQETEASSKEQLDTGEQDPTEVSETAARSESEIQQSRSTSYVSLHEPGTEPESPTTTSEDTLELDESESWATDVAQGISCSDQPDGPQKYTLNSDFQQVAWLEDTRNKGNKDLLERHDSFEDQTAEIMLESGYVHNTQDMNFIPHENSENIPDPGDGVTPQNSVVDHPGDMEELRDTGNSENSQTIREEKLQLCLDHSNSEGGVLPTLNATDLVEDSLLFEEQPSVTELRGDASSKPVVRKTDSARTETSETQEVQEKESELHQNTHVKALQKGLVTETDVPLENQVDLPTETCPDVNSSNDASMIQRERNFMFHDCTQESNNSKAQEKRRNSVCTESPRLPAQGSTGSATVRDSGSDTDGFISTDTGEDNIFRKEEEVVGAGNPASEVSASCSSTDNAAILGPPISSAESSKEAQRVDGFAAAVDADEEAKDRLTEVPLCSSLLHSSRRSQSPFRRHSWEPGINWGAGGDMSQRSSVRSAGNPKPVFHRRSYSLEGLAAEQDDGKGWQPQRWGPSQGQRGERRGSHVSLPEEGPESDQGEHHCLDDQKLRRYLPVRRSGQSMTLPLQASVSMLAISQRDIDGLRSYASTSSSLGYSITEEEPGPLKEGFEGKSGTKMSRTFSYLKSKMYKKTREKDKEKNREKDREAKDREKKAVSGHLFSSVTLSHTASCQHCNKPLSTKDAVSCTSCNVCVHKSCRDNIPVCPKGKIQKQQLVIPELTTMPGVTLRVKNSAPRERPWSAILSPDDQHLGVAPRRHTSIMPFNSSNLSKSMSISNIAVFDDMSIKGLRYLSQSTDSLHKVSKVVESTESLIDEGTEMIDGQLMGEFEAETKELEADSWSFTTDKKYLKKLRKDVIKRQDVIYELIQTEMHHLRTLRIMADVYSKGLLKEVQLEMQTVEKMFPVLDDLLELHTLFFNSLLDRRREARQEGADDCIVIHRIGDVLVSQFSGSNAESMKKVYGKFCSRHSEAVNLYKELHAKDKRFQAFIRKKMSSSVVRRLSIPECILLVTQRITKYPVLMQRILQHTKDHEEDFEDLTQALHLVKEVIAAVDRKVNEHEKKRRLKEIYSRTDGKSIMRMKSGQMFAREDLIRGRKLLHDGPLQLKNSAGRLKDVQALLLTDVLVFLQEKDQKYVFASLDQRATVISLQKLIVREVANEDRGLFLITAGIKHPEMVEVHATSREERNTWMKLLQGAMHSIEKDDDEGIPSETEEDKKLLESKAKEMRDMLQRKDDQILALLQEKMKLFHDMCEYGSTDDAGLSIKMLFRACSDETPKGETLMKDAIREVEMLQTLVNSSLGGAMGQQVDGGVGTAASVCLPRRADTFGGFDSHQMNTSKNAEGGEPEDLRRTESDSILKKGGNAHLLLLLKRNSEVLSSVTHLHDLLNSLQAVVVQQDTLVEDQRQALSERTSSQSSLRTSSRPPSLVEQEKQRSLERHRQDAAALQRQQTAHAEERRRREKEWEAREKELAERELLLHAREDEARRGRRELEEAQQELQGRKEDYQRDLERLRDSQRRLERDKELLQREMEKVEHLRETEDRLNRTLSSTSEDSLNVQGSTGSLEREPGEVDRALSPMKSSLSRVDSKQKSRNLNPFSLGPRAASGEKQIPSCLLQLTRAKDKKEKKKKKSKVKPSREAESHLLPLAEPALDGEIFFC